MGRAAVACAVTAVAGSGRRPRYRRPAARDRPRPGRDLAGMTCPGLGPSGSELACISAGVGRGYPSARRPVPGRVSEQAMDELARDLAARLGGPAVSER
jgi:hypothetical protein